MQAGAAAEGQAAEAVPAAPVEEQTLGDGQGDVLMLNGEDDEEEEEEDPSKVQATEEAHKEMDKIHIFRDLKDLKSDAAQKAGFLFLSH